MRGILGASLAKLIGEKNFGKLRGFASDAFNFNVIARFRKRQYYIFLQIENFSNNERCNRIEREFKEMMIALAKKNKIKVKILDSLKLLKEKRADNRIIVSCQIKERTHDFELFDFNINFLGNSIEIPCKTEEEGYKERVAEVEEHKSTLRNNVVHSLAIIMFRNGSPEKAINICESFDKELYIKYNKAKFSHYYFQHLYNNNTILGKSRTSKLIKEMKYYGDQILDFWKYLDYLCQNDEDIELSYYQRRPFVSCTGSGLRYFYGRIDELDISQEINSVMKTFNPRSAVGYINEAYYHLTKRNNLLALKSYQKIVDKSLNLSDIDFNSIISFLNIKYSQTKNESLEIGAMVMIHLAPVEVRHNLFSDEMEWYKFKGLDRKTRKALKKLGIKLDNGVKSNSSPSNP